MTQRRRSLPLLPAGLVLLIALAPVRAHSESEPVIHLVSIVMNGVERAGIFVMLQVGSEFMLEVPDFQSLGLLTPKGKPLRQRGRDFLALNAVSGLTYSFDQRQLQLQIDCTAACFPAKQLAQGWKYVPPTPTPLGVSLNYDLLAQKDDFDTFVGGVADFGFFSKYGLGRLGITAQDLTEDRKVTRLDTSWTIDEPESRLRYRFGDSITAPGGWGLAARFGGIQYGTDFSLQPGFVSFPTPTIGGEAALPSTVDIFVDDVRRQRLEVGPGPFTIDQPPVITGAGDLRVVVRDLLGRETVIVQPFYASRRLLLPDLEDYSVEAGLLRKDYGLASNSYEEPFVSGSYRVGVTDYLSDGFHAEVSTRRAAIGPTVDWQTPLGGVLSGAAAVSLHESRPGGLLQLGFDWSSPTLSFQLANEMATAGFSRLGASETRREPRMTNSANFGVSFAPYGSVSLNYTRVDERDRSDFSIASANYSVQLFDLGALGVNAYRSFGESADTGLFLSFTVRLGPRTTASTSFDRSGGRWTGTARASHSAPSDGGFGARAEVSRGGVQREQASVSYDSTKGIAQLDVSRRDGASATRLDLRGGMALMDGDVYLADPLSDGFALVEVGDYPGVGVLRDNQRVTETDSSGRAFISGLRAYERNKIAIDPLDLPLSSEIGATSLELVPRRGSGVIADFPVTRVVAAQFRVVDRTGNPLPPGSVLHSFDGKDEFPIGFDGLTYVTGLEKPRDLYAHTDTGLCTIRVPAVEPAPVAKRLGSLTCVDSSP